MATAFSIEFTPKEFFYFLFKKKICPKCGEKMKKQKRSELVDGRMMYDSVKESIFLKRSEVRHDYYVFICTACRQEFSLAELVHKK